MWVWAALAVWATAEGGGMRGVAGAGAGCGVAQFACAGGGACIPLDRYCDSRADCPDSSDEPRGCSVCNRTYYGMAGVAYSLSLLEVGRVPFLCHLTFTAGGGAHGDLVQLAFDEFRVGRFEPGALDGCPDGYMQVAELGRPFTGGSWCGSAAGPALYYSETSTLTLSVKLFRARLGEPFKLVLRYKFLQQKDAVVRFGLSSAPVSRGAVSPGTYCTRTYEECHRQRCRLQSPNYPGMYPRNVTCYWSLRQKDIPTCKHAMISVRQEQSHKIQIKRSISMASLNKTRRAVRAWRECTGERDRVLVYDGASTDDPVLVEYCGGDWLPPVTARGPDMLVAFHSSPYSAPPRPAPPPNPLRGFELDVDVIFADSDSLDYAREARRCEFHVKASSSLEENNTTAVGPAGGANAGAAGRGRRGRVRAPQHTLPPNTTCTWTFHGRPGDLVWIYFSSFTQYSLVESRRTESSEREEGNANAIQIIARARGSTREELRESYKEAKAREKCAVQLKVWEGGGGELGRYCDSPPALCARASLANATRSPRPCAPPDGYVSSGSILSMSTHTTPGTATHPLRFSLHYEFVDARLDGVPWRDVTLPGAVPSECARLLNTPGEFSSPRNVLWFGRGGAKSLRCYYRIQASGGPVVLNVTEAAFGRSPRCSTRADPRTGRLVCVPEPIDPADAIEDDEDVDDQYDEDINGDILKVPHLMIYESPWPGYRVSVACICDNTSTPLTILARGGALELRLSAARLSAREDQHHVRMRASWDAPSSASSRVMCGNARKLAPPGGHLHLVYPYSDSRLSECGEAPFLLSARGNRSVFARVWGEELPPAPPAAAGAPAPAAEVPPCHTTNRVLVYDANTSRLMRVICPGEEGSSRVVHVFTPEWRNTGSTGATGGAALLVVWAAREPGAAVIAWMEVWRPRDAGANVSALCERPCVPLGACMPPDLWCNGAADCPGGGDERGACGAGARLLAALGASGAGAAGAGGAAALLLLAVAVVWRRRRHSASKQLVGTSSGLNSRALTEELLFDASRASSVAS